MPVRIALASPPFPASLAESVELAASAIQQAGASGAAIVCFPECFVPGLRGVGRPVAAVGQDSLEAAWAELALAAARARIGVILGTERYVGEQLRATALVIYPDGSFAGFQDKVQLDPTEEGIYSPGEGRSLFEVGGLTFGVAICHEGWRYPETVRWAAVRGAQVVFHPQFSPSCPEGYTPQGFADPANSFHEKAALCRAAENTCYFATVNYAIPRSQTACAVVSPDGTLLAHQPHGQPGVLVVEVDPALATGLLARRWRPQ